MSNMTMHRNLMHKNLISPNYNRHEGSKTPKWIIEIDEMIITNLEGQKSEKTIRLWA